MIRNLGQVAAIYIGSSAPRNTNLIWLDNTVVPFVFRAYDGLAWSEIATHKWVRAYVDGWLVTLPPRQLADDGDYMLINSNNVNYKITVKDFVKSAVGNPLDFKGIIRVSADFPNPSTLEAGDMYVIITSPVGGTVTDPYSGKTFEDSEKIVWDEVTRSWESLGKINITVNLTTSYSETEVTIHSSAGKETTIQGVTDQLAGVMLPGQYLWLQALSNGSIVPGDPSPLTPLTPAHKHNYNDIINRLVSQQGTGESTIDPMSQKATTDALNLKFDKASVLQVSGAATDKVMSQKAVTDALKTLSDDFNNKLTNYLPLSGGTMTGSIIFPNRRGIIGRLVDGTGNIQIAVVNANNNVEIGDINIPLMLVSNSTDLIHYRDNNTYKIWDSYNLSKPTVYNGGAIGTPTTIYDRNLSVNGTGWTFLSATNAPTTSIFAPTTVGTKGYYLVSSGTGAPVWQQLEDLGDGKYLPLIGGTLTGQVTIQQNVDIKLRLQSTDTDNYCIIQAINSQASQLGAFGYAGDKWAITHNGTYYEIWDKYNLTNPVTYTTNTYNHATLTNKDRQYFTYIKTGTNGLLPHSKVALVSGGSGSLGTSDQSFNAAYINNLHTNKVTFGETGPYIIGSTSATQFLDANGGVQKVATGGLYVGVSYASDALNLVPTNGIYSRGIIYIENGIGFRNSIWTNDLTPNKNYSGYLQVLDAYDASSAGGPTNYGTVLQVNSRNAHWANQLWFSGGAEASKNGLYYRHMAYNETKYGNWIKLATTSDLGNYLPLSGGTISSSKPYPLIINSTHVSQSSINFSREGVDKGTVGFYESLGSFLQNVTGETLAVKSDGAYYGANIDSLRKLATVTDLNNYLPLTGGTLNGALTINGPNTLYHCTLNSSYTRETVLSVQRKGIYKAAFGYYDGIGAFLYNYPSAKYLFVDDNGDARVGTTNGSTKLALITDIPTVSGYLPLSGGTMSGNISFNGDTGHIVVGARETSNFVSAVSFNKGSATNSAYIGYHSTGGSDSSGALVLVPYPTSANPWGKAVGLYIAKNELLLDGKAIATQEYVTWNNVAGKPTIYERTIGINGTYWSFYAPTNATSAMIYGPTSAGTSGQILQSTGGVPKWVNASSVVGNFVSKSGDTMTGALTMNSRRHNIVVDVVGGAGNNWDEGAGALSVQIPNDAGQTPLLLARRSGAAIDTTTAAERLLSMELLDNGHSFIIGMSGSKALQLDWTSNKAGTGKLFGKTIATTDKIPSIPSISISNSGSGNAVTSITASGHTLTVTKGATYLTSSSLNGYATQTWANGQFAPLSRFNTSTGYTTIKVTGQEFNFDSDNPEIYMNYRTLSGSTAVTKITWKAGGGANSTALCEGRWGNLYMNNNLVATQSWVNNKGYLTSHQTIYDLTFQAGTFAAKTFDPNGAAATVNIPTKTSHITNDSGFITSSALNGYATQSWVNSQNFVKSTSTKKVTDIQPVDALPATQASGVLYLVFG